MEEAEREGIVIGAATPLFLCFRSYQQNRAKKAELSTKIIVWSKQNKSKKFSEFPRHLL